MLKVFKHVRLVQLAVIARMETTQSRHVLQERGPWELPILATNVRQVTRVQTQLHRRWYHAWLDLFLLVVRRLALLAMLVLNVQAKLKLPVQSSCMLNLGRTNVDSFQQVYMLPQIKILVPAVHPATFHYLEKQM